MVRDKAEPYVLVRKSDIMKLGDFRLATWLSVLQDYAKRFKRDKFGYIRVPIDVIKEDYGLYRTKVWRYNKQLEDKGFIKVDRTSRGGRTWMGYRFI